MKALILNSGIGKRMGTFTEDHPKCMTTLSTNQTILERQISQLENAGIGEVIITTGPFADILERHVVNCVKNSNVTYVNNPDYATTNYIYSIFLAREYLDSDIVMLHGDLVFEDGVLPEILNCPNSAMTVSSTLPLPEKDFKAVIKDGIINKIGIEFFDNALAAQPLYYLNYKDWKIWLDKIINFVEKNDKKCYAENAFNYISNKCHIYPFDVVDRLCAEIDTPEDLESINKFLTGGKQY